MNLSRIPYYKVGGFLLLFVFLLAVGSVISVVMDIQALVAGRDLLGVTFNLLQSAAWWVALVLILRLDWRGIRLARVLLAVGILVGLLGHLRPCDVAGIVQDTVGMFGVAAIDALWLIYLKMSQRVNFYTVWQHRPGWVTPQWKIPKLPRTASEPQATTPFRPLSSQ